TRLITDGSGDVTTDVSYTPFGEDVLNGKEDTSLYTGKGKDVIDLYYYGARYYNPRIGRFITRDTASGSQDAPQTLNKYAYCLNNPLTYVDPTGNESEDPVWDAFNNIDWSLVPLDEIQELIDEGDLLGALVLLVEALIAQGIPFEIVKDEEGNITDILYSEDTGDNVCYFQIRLTTCHELYEMTGDRKALVAAGMFLYGENDGIWLTTDSFVGAFADAKKLASVLGHEAVHAHDFITKGFEGVSELRAYMWYMKNWFKMRWPF
ncbi:MAG: RHS repeat-associated core domain-containing protein, partial [Theionarchaea archaeon]|nr:RHS repeat-associated core domain-containing protein [Theionarchaea archaeon]